jgi:hypothetical protein
MLTTLPAYAGLTVQDGRLTDDAGDSIDFRLAPESMVMDDFRNFPEIPMRRPESPVFAAALTPEYLKDESGSLECPERIEFDHTSNPQTFDIIASANLEVSAPANLFVFNGGDAFLTATYANGVLEVTPQENTTFNERYASVTVVALGNEIAASVVIGIKQKGKPRKQAAAAAVNQPDPISWRAVASTMRRLRSAGSTAIRVSFGEVADRASAALELSRLTDLCRQNTVVCIVEITPSAGRSQLGTGVTPLGDYIMSPEVRQSLYGTEDAVILDLGEPAQGTHPGIAGHNTLVKELRSYGFNHLFLVEGSDAQVPASHAGLPGNGRLAHDPATNVILSLAPREAGVSGAKALDTPATLADAVNTPRTSTRRSITLNGRVLTVDPAVLHFGRGAINFDGPSITFEKGSSTTSATPTLSGGFGGFGRLSLNVTSGSTSSILLDSSANTGAPRAFARVVEYRTGPRGIAVLQVALDIEQD